MPGAYQAPTQGHKKGAFGDRDRMTHGRTGHNLHLAQAHLQAMANPEHTGRSDTVDAKLSPGEFVVPADVVSHLGEGDTHSGGAWMGNLVAAVRAHALAHSPQGTPEQARAAAGQPPAGAPPLPPHGAFPVAPGAPAPAAPVHPLIAPRPGMTPPGAFPAVR